MASVSCQRQSVHNFTVEMLEGMMRSTNTNYTELAELYGKYIRMQFGGQEPGSNEEILEVACTRFKAQYPILDKIDVNGPNASPLYKYLKSSKGGLFGDKIKWNFSKFLMDKDGNVLDRCAPTTAPHSIEDIKKLLEKASVLKLDAALPD